MNADHPVRPGQRIGKYILGEPIARGGMAEVWSARVEGPEGFVKSFALKFVLESFRGDSELERLFVNEARVAAQLQHANLVSVFDFDKIEDPGDAGSGRYYIAMERVDGHDLRRVGQDAHRRGQRLPTAVMLHIAGEVLKGLRHVHERRNPENLRPLGLVHRDVSPHNILIGMGGEVKLSDFGIAKAMAQSFGTQSGLIRGKLAYASPEQLRNEPLDHRTDQFALGVTLWEGLAGRRLFEGADAREIIAKVNVAEVPPLPPEAGVAKAVEAIVRRMLAAPPRARFSSTAEALSAVLGAPGYTADAAPLAALMSTLFAPPSREVPPTLRLHGVQAEAGNVHAGLAATGLAETKTLDRGPPDRGASAQPNAAALAHSEIPTVNDRARGRATVEKERRPARARAIGGAREQAKERVRARDPLSVTGSSYVSGAFSDDAVRAARVRPPAGAMVVMGAVAVALLGVIGFVAWRGARRDEPAASGAPGHFPTAPLVIEPARPEARRLPAPLEPDAVVDEEAAGGPSQSNARSIAAHPDDLDDEAQRRRKGRGDGRHDSNVRAADYGPTNGWPAASPLPPAAPPRASPPPDPPATPQKATAGPPVGPGLMPNGAPVLQ